MTAPLFKQLDHPDALVLYGETFASRLLLGTSRYPSPQVLENAIQTSNPGMITVSLRRQGTSTTEAHSGFWDLLKKMAVPVLPNTAGCHSPQEVITTAQMAREVFETDWIKLELIGDDYTLQPDTLRLVATAETLIKDGFKVLPYCTEDLILCQRSAIAAVLFFTTRFYQSLSHPKTRTGLVPEVIRWATLAELFCYFLTC